MPNLGGVNAQTGASYTLQTSDRGKLVTFSNASAIALALPNSLPGTFLCGVQVEGAGTLTLTPATGTINSQPSLALSSGQGGLLFFDGTNWAAITGSSGGSSGGSGSGTPIEVNGVTVGNAAIGVPVVGFLINSGATGTNVGPVLIAPGPASVSKCVVVVKASDAAVALTFVIKQNGTSVFSGSNTVAAGTTSLTVVTFTNLTSSPLAISAGDLFTIDITSGSSSWIFTTQLE